MRLIASCMIVYLLLIERLPASCWEKNAYSQNPGLLQAEITTDPVRNRTFCKLDESTAVRRKATRQKRSSTLSLLQEAKDKETSHEAHEDEKTHHASHHDVASHDETPSEEEKEQALPKDPALFFPKLFAKAFTESNKAKNAIESCLETLDDIKGDMDSIPHDEDKMPILSEHVNIEVASKELSVQSIISQLRELSDKLRSLSAYLSSARTQINFKLRKVLPTQPPKPQ